MEGAVAPGSDAQAPTERGYLSAADWIDAALELLATHGPSGMRVNDIAAALGVTKGSFYWHFRDRGELLRALAERWAGDRTVNRLRRVETAGNDPRARLRAVRDEGTAVARIDRAMREWARHDVVVADAVRRADRRVLATLQRCFTDLDFSQTEADLRARTLLYAFVGQYDVRLDDTGAGPGAFDRLVTLLTARVPTEPHPL